MCTNDHRNAWYVAFEPEAGIVGRGKDPSGSPQVGGVPLAPGLDRFVDNLSPVITQASQTEITGGRFRLAAVPAVAAVKVCARADRVVVVQGPVVSHTSQHQQFEQHLG